MNTEWAKVPEVTGPEGFAIKALANGTASEIQQKTAWEFIIKRLCRTDESSFVLDRDGGDRASCFVEGRRSVGIALRALVAVPSDKLHNPKGD